MAFYQDSWLILLSPLFSFAVIIFGTRMWDLASRGRVAATSGPEAAALAAEESGTQLMEGHGPHGEEEVLEDDEDPKVPRLTMGARVSGYTGIVILALACIYSWLILLNSAGVINIAPALPTSGVTVLSYDWFNQGTASYIISFHLDTLAITMMVVVTTVSLLVQFYSQGYMENSAGYARFFSYLSLFTFSMLVIVFAQNFLVIFVGWELVGLSSYLLIGFWINKRAKPDEDRLSPATASIMAFITTRVGDVGFIIGIMILFTTTGTFEFATLASKTDPHGVIHAFAGNTGLLTAAMILVFCGAIGKSAQLPLTVWLPPAMEGPTPVSALIHAATMVAAGVYMVARTFPLFAAADPAAFQVVAWVGAITALYAALTALTQTDFKRVLAFSTISQLGYMFVGLGVAGTVLGPGPGMFHLFTHAFFKALLFLGAGSVIHALHHATHKEVQEMSKMGGLAKYMPITAITWLVATLTISGFPFFSGFYSKDNIIGLAFQHGYYGLYVITLGTAGLTAFYMLRAYILAFGGKGGGFGGLWGGTYRGEGEPHESPRTITIPLVLLAIASIVAGYWTGFFGYIQPGAPNLDLGVVFTDPLTWIGVVVSFVGLGWAYVLYTRFELAAIHDFVEGNIVLRFLHRLTLRKFYIDNLYDLLIRYVVFGISHIEAAFDTYVVDGIVNGVAGAVTGAGRGARRLETGKVQAYMVGFFGGIAVLAIVVVALVMFVK
ncbi:MAG TPA: NADH-quinone oxidoreductase subunit L [Ktedonobacteraceae bacterium]|nr:NADH-quinone oxidoreductase subunit L [Ktedonobacteraceae bacterium]